MYTYVYNINIIHMNKQDKKAWDISKRSLIFENSCLFHDICKIFMLKALMPILKKYIVVNAI